MVDIIRQRLLSAGYKTFTFQDCEIKYFYKSDVSTCYLLALVDYRNPNESNLTAEAVSRFQVMAVKQLEQMGFTNVKTHTVIVTYSEEIAASLVGTSHSYWVMDSYHNTLIIPQWQPRDFGNLLSVLRPIVEDGMYNTRSVGNRQGAKRPLAIMNTAMVLANVLVFLYLESIGSTLDSYFMYKHGAFFWPAIVEDGEIYRFITCMFMHFGFSHLFGNMLVLFFLGDNLERAVGRIKYLLIYFVTGLASSVVSCAYYLITDEIVVSAGASGAIFGVIGALCRIVWVNKGKLEDLDSFRLTLFVVFSLYSGFTSTGVDNAAHVGGFIAGLIMAGFLYKKPQTALAR